jgi:PAS domain S-box-containing protein
MSGLNDKFFRTLEHYPEYCFLVTSDGTIVDVNKAYIDKSKSLKEELLGGKIESILYKPSVLKFDHALARCEKEISYQTFESKLQMPGDVKLDVQLFLSPCFSESNSTEKVFLIIAKDITHERQTEIDFMRFYSVAENTVNPLQITDLSGKMTFVNQAFCKASGYSAEELLGKNPNVFSSRKYPKQFWDDMWGTISEGRVWFGEVENKKKSGEPFYTQLLISPIVDNNKKVLGYFGIHRDLTERRNLEKQLIHTQKMESIGTLAAGVAHEVGNPLASISALVQIIQRQTTDDFIKEKSELVKKQITRISKIIRDLVDFSRPSNYELKLTDINENIRESIEIVRVGKKAKDIEFIQNLDVTLPPLPLVSDQLQQVFVNILINAVDAIIERRTQVPIEERGMIKVASSMDKDFCKITFEDNGIGVKDDKISKIFEPFFTTKTEGKGTGLGLWVSYGIVKSFQGDIKVESKYHKYTKFIIHLPAKSVF